MCCKLAAFYIYAGNGTKLAEHSLQSIVCCYLRYYFVISPIDGIFKHGYNNHEKLIFLWANDNI